MINILPSKTGDGVPYEMWFKKKARIDNLRPFGCLSYVFTQKDFRSKLQTTAEKGLMLGYVNDFTSYKILKINSKTPVHSVHVKFDEEKFPGISAVTQNSQDLFQIQPTLSKIKKNPTNMSNLNQNFTEDQNTSFNPSTVTSENISPSNSSKIIDGSINSNNILPYNRRGVFINSFLSDAE